MHSNSPPVRSAQDAPHPRLREVVRRHLEAPFRRVPSDAGRRAFAAVADRLAERPFVLDAGCGTGVSTLALAMALAAPAQVAAPPRLVLGVDKSAARLASGLRVAAAPGAPPNALLLLCELVDFWQLAAAAGLRCERQYLMYPNPWPKPEHLRRRWHAHAVLPSILALGGPIELRTNWPVYAEEFALALRVAGWRADCARCTPHAPVSPFERKYAQSGHALWRCVAEP